MLYDEVMQTPQIFLKDYEIKTNSHDFTLLRPLIADDAVYWFTDGSFVGIAMIRDAITTTFNTIQHEVYSIKDVEWIVNEETTAVCRYRFEWSGIVDGKEKHGAGRGTNVMVKRDGVWRMLHEHLSA